MKSSTSVSGGKTSAYLAKHFPTDYYVFCLVRIEDERCRYQDKIMRTNVEDKIQAPFIATAEDDEIIHTIFDLEQYLGKEIIWLTGITFDEVIKTKGGWLPNKLHRYSTQWLKIEPMVQWWYKNFTDPILVNIGFRAEEKRRVIRMHEKSNKEGLLEFKTTFKKNKNGTNHWDIVAWQKSQFPLYDNRIYKTDIEKFWIGKPVRFAERNNCVGCFHRNPLLLKKMSEIHPAKLNWFSEQEGGKNDYWRSDVSYKKIIESELQFELDFNDFSECDDGLCEL